MPFLIIRDMSGPISSYLPVQICFDITEGIDRLVSIELELNSSAKAAGTDKADNTAASIQAIHFFFIWYSSLKGMTFFLIFNYNVKKLYGKAIGLF